MDVAVVCEKRFEEYIVNTFQNHKTSDVKLKCFCDWNRDRDGGLSFGIPVIPLTSIQDGDYDTILLAGFNTGYLSQMMRVVHDEKLNHILAIKWFSLTTRKDFIIRDRFDGRHVVEMPGGGEKPCLGELQVHVSDNCNLNCKACSHFTPFVLEHRCTDLKIFEKDLIQLSRLFSNIFVFQLMGGEPLLEPTICVEMIDLIRRYFQDCSINLITNGMLIGRMDKSFWEHVKEQSVTVRVSVYPAVLSKLDIIKGTLNYWDIPYLCEVNNKVEFEKNLTLTYATNPYDNMRRCHGRGCYSLVSGRVSKCPNSIYIRDMVYALRQHNIEFGNWIYGNDAIVLEDENDGWDIIKRLEAPCELCSRCDISNHQMIPWEMTKGKVELKDWFIDYQ